MEDPTSFIGQNVRELPTPALLVDRGKVVRNCERMRQKSELLGVKLRVHIKTHKTVEGAIIQTNGTKRCLVVSTLQEAHFMASAGFDDILLGFPLVPHLRKRCEALLERLEAFHVFVNSEAGVGVVEEAASSGKKWSVFLKVDVGYHRAGVPHTSLPRILSLVTRLCNSPHVTFRGLYAHCGDSYTTSRDDVRRTRDDSVARLVAVKAAILDAGLTCQEIGIGSTPSCSLATAEEMKNLTEMHPGNYVFYDAQQSSYGSCSYSDIAVRVMCRVVSHHQDRNQVLVDLGFTGFTKQGLDLLDTPGFGAEQGANLKLVAMTQELGKMETLDGSPMDYEKFPIGREIFIYPYHACATAGMYGHYYVHDDNGVVVEIWRPTRGW